ncbi:MAG: cation diffusion facilitator family transporter [bacterium]
MQIAVSSEADRRALAFAMTLSLVVGIMMFVMKVTAYLMTGSAAILSDAAESVVHVAAVAFAFYSLRLSFKPADSSHLYGHAKISFFSAGFEGAMIIIAALYIIYESIHKWLAGLVLENLGYGTMFTAAATLINGALGAFLIWTGRRRRSLILEANGKHVLTDCWTSLGVLVGLGLVLITKWLPWDPITGIVAATNILFSGIGLIRTSASGLMDRADEDVQRRLVEILDRETASRGVGYHDLRHRNVGDATWVDLHLLFAAEISVQDAHRTATEIERAVEASLGTRVHVTSHLESWEDHDHVHAGEVHA